MHDFPSYKRSAVRYWEWRRVFYNLVLVPPAGFCYVMVAGIEAAQGGEPVWTTTQVVIAFVVAAIGANLCYSFAYVLEFLFADDSPESRWLCWGRTVALIAGAAAAIVLAFYGGASIAMREYGVQQ